MTRDEIYSELRLLGFSGSVEDMLYAYLPGDGALEDKIFTDDPFSHGTENWIKKKLNLRPPNIWDDSEIWNDTNTWEDYQSE
jgi:hypothetical protein